MPGPLVSASGSIGAADVRFRRRLDGGLFLFAFKSDHGRRSNCSLFNTRNPLKHVIGRILNAGTGFVKLANRFESKVTQCKTVLSL